MSEIEIEELLETFDLREIEAGSVKSDKPDIQKAFRMGQKCCRRGEWAEAVQHLLVVWDDRPTDKAVLILLAFSLVQLGVREQAIRLLEKVLQHHEPDPDFCSVMLQLASELEMFEIAVKVGNVLISMDPTGAPQHYVNLASAYAGCGKYDDAISLLQAAIPIFPEHADLWNVLGTTVRQRDGIEASLVFFDEGLRLEPDNFKILSNYAHAKLLLGDELAALDMDLRAIKANPKIAEPHVGAAQILFYLGRMEEAWEHYEFRRDSRRKSNQNQIYTHKIPEWTGESLEGKSLFVGGEQGIGDEMMWGHFLPFLYEQADKLLIGCERRLASIYKRRFPNADVFVWVDQIRHGYRLRSFPEMEAKINAGELHVDLSIPVASSPRFDWTSGDKVKAHPEGFCTPDPDRLADFKKRLGDISDKPKVGLAWRSGRSAWDRDYLYATMEDMAPLFALSDKLDFVNLQYGDCAKEIAHAKDLYGVTIHNFEDVNYKDDIEANMAIARACDIVVSACTAPAMFSMASGATTLIMVPDRPWWCFGEESKIPFTADAEAIYVRKEQGWEDILGKVTGKLTEKLGL